VFESSTLSGFAAWVIFVIVLLLLRRVIERGCGRFNASRGRRKSENNPKAVIKNKDAETKTLSCDVDAFDRLESSNRRIETGDATTRWQLHVFTFPELMMYVWHKQRHMSNQIRRPG
jgi:hypothetical protein